MPLPLPNLDTRRWAEMTDAARALIPRYAPQWTDFNVHDPGITLLELLAWLVEQDIYQVNRIPIRHRLKFLSLIGFAPRPATSARVALSFTRQPAGADIVLPQGMAFAATAGSGPEQPFLLTAPLTVVAAQIQAVQTFDGATFSDQTQAWKDGRPLHPLGASPVSLVSDPEKQPALYLGFDQSLPPGVMVRLGLQLQGTSDGERARLIVEGQWQATLCPPWPPRADCPPTTSGLAVGESDRWCPPDPELPAGSTPATRPAFPDWRQHYAVRIAWDYYDGMHWRSLDPQKDEVVDETRGFTLSGSVSITLPTAMVARTVGVVPGALFPLRARLEAGPPDIPPVLLNVDLNTAWAEQAVPVWHTFTIQPNVLPPAGQEPAPGTKVRLSLTFAADGTITALAVESDGSGPEVTVLDYQAATSALPGRLSLTLIPLGTGTQTPQQQIQLPGVAVAGSALEIWTTAAGALTQPWRLRPDFDASQRTDWDFVQDAVKNIVTFGNGERGQVVPYGDWIFAVYSATDGAAGQMAAGKTWEPAASLTDWNRFLLNANPAAIGTRLQFVVNRISAACGADPETWEHAAGRAAETLWAHERLIKLCPAGACATLDQLPRDAVLALPAPERAVTLQDYERLALDVPGTRVVRARAWADIDPAFPCLKAPGTVTVVLVPGLPRYRPQPTDGLLQTVRRFLSARHTLGTRLRVVGPQYVAVSIQATVVSLPAASPTRVQSDILAALARFLDPIDNGPTGHGWPFGRAVYRAEVLKILHDVSGVDHVQSLEMSADGNPGQCGNLCVGSVSLVTPGTHSIQVL